MLNALGLLLLDTMPSSNRSTWFSSSKNLMGHKKVNKIMLVFTDYFVHIKRVYWFRDTELARKIGAAVALEVRATGIPFIFAPCLAVCICSAINISSR